MNFLRRRWRNFRPRHGFRKSWRIWIYVAIFATLLVETVSGFAIYKPVQLSELVSLFGSYQTARWVHLAGLFAIVILVIIHIIEVVFSGWNSIRSMVAGFKVNYEV